MPEHYTYLLVDVTCLLFPFIFSFHPRILFHKQWKHFIAPCLVTALIFVTWDVLFTWQGVWSFNPRYILGIYLFHLPLEEYLFFFCIPYPCVFTYYSISKFYSLPRSNKAAYRVTSCLIVGLAAASLCMLPRLYTSVTFLLLAGFLLFVRCAGFSFLPVFYVSYLVILLPFFISNGILTGTGLPQPVVQYNNQYNTGIRILTIPFEDFFYGMLLMLMNVTGFEYLAARPRRQEEKTRY